jgi:hypothetical protein
LTGGGVTGREPLAGLAGGGALASSSEMILRMEARISSIDDSGTWFGLAIRFSAAGTNHPRAGTCCGH